MLYKIFGNNGKHTRIAVGCASLPKKCCCRDFFNILYKINNHQSLALKRQHLKKPKIGILIIKKPILVN